MTSDSTISDLKEMSIPSDVFAYILVPLVDNKTLCELWKGSTYQLDSIIQEALRRFRGERGWQNSDILHDYQPNDIRPVWITEDESGDQLSIELADCNFPGHSLTYEDIRLHTAAVLDRMIATSKSDLDDCNEIPDEIPDDIYAQIDQLGEEIHTYGTRLSVAEAIDKIWLGQEKEITIDTDRVSLYLRRVEK